MSFTDREYEMALDLLVGMNEALGAEEPCSLCFNKKREWCAEHCDKKNSEYPDKECFKKYFLLKVQQEIDEEINKTKEIIKENKDYELQFI